MKIFDLKKNHIEMATYNANRQLASKHSLLSVRVAFKNISPRKIDLYWISHESKLVQYSSNLAPGTMTGIISFVGHPWVATDSLTGQKMFLNGFPDFRARIPAEFVSEQIGPFADELSEKKKGINGAIWTDQDEDKLQAIKDKLNSQDVMLISIHIPSKFLDNYRVYLITEDM